MQQARVEIKGGRRRETAEKSGIGELLSNFYLRVEVEIL